MGWRHKPVMWLLTGSEDGVSKAYTDEGVLDQTVIICELRTANLRTTNLQTKSDSNSANQLYKRRTRKNVKISFSFSAA